MGPIVKPPCFCDNGCDDCRPPGEEPLKEKKVMRCEDHANPIPCRACERQSELDDMRARSRQKHGGDKERQMFEQNQRQNEAYTGDDAPTPSGWRSRSS